MNKLNFWIKFKEFFEYVKRINVFVLSSSLTFYAILIITPLINIIYGLLGELEIDKYQEFAFSNSLSIFSIIIIGINSIWVASKLLNITFIIADIIYVDIPNRSSLKLRIKSFIMMFALVWFIILEIIALLSLVGLMNYLNQNSNWYYLTIWMEFICQFVSIVLLIGFIYKYVIPVKIKFRTAFFSGLLVSIVWYIFTFIYRIICNVFNLWSNVYVYGVMTNYLVMIMWIYFLCMVFIYGLILTFYLIQMTKKINDGYNIKEQERSNEY